MQFSTDLEGQTIDLSEVDQNQYLNVTNGFKLYIASFIYHQRLYFVQSGFEYAKVLLLICGSNMVSALKSDFYLLSIISKYF